MNVKYRGPVLVPDEHLAEIEKLSKAALMDLVWSFVGRCTNHPSDHNIDTFRDEWKIVKEYRQ